MDKGVLANRRLSKVQFVGAYDVKVDGKRRVILPSKLSEILFDCVSDDEKKDRESIEITAVSIDNSGLALLPNKSWLSVFNRRKDNPELQNELVKDSHLIRIDKQRRFLLPKYIVNPPDKVKIYGNGDYIWVDVSDTSPNS
jgi:DNA-binding transcriptional regulator/RsmH inhibitor MraZ